ncbi:CheR family methyltransferase [Desulfogranum mediterraneum]|uniref:CheR family methyltransferase n=1 Tax=Desulfogranum mediterraneum TaxID=160661 RepID=UPI000415BAC7|nr:protein-glutamate O-methyltransferase CheR [Desulfogranum mediterraneum]
MDNEELEITLLLEAMQSRYGYDFRGYARASLTRRIKKGLAETGLQRISELIPPILYDRDFFNKFVANLSVHVTEMFRDPLFFKALREEVIPYLKTFPFIKIWSAGISTGEEVYSLAIVLKEEGLYEKSRIYATDFSDTVLEKARKGIYPTDLIKKSTKNYQKSGGSTSFGNYYHADYESAIFDRALKKNIVFANHNMVTDSVFGEMHLILCRNVLIYFDANLQNHVFQLFFDSLRPNGFLCLGSKETLEYSKEKDNFVAVIKRQKIYQKKKTHRGYHAESL